jgi:hypothetical protein
MSDANTRGRRNESLVEQALTRIVQTTKMVLGFTRSKPYSEEDRHGKDFVLKIPSGREIALQVKSSLKAARRFARKAKENIISVVVVQDSDTVETLLGRLIELIQRASQTVRRHAKAFMRREHRSHRVRGTLCAAH